MEDFFNNDTVNAPQARVALRWARATPATVAPTYFHTVWYVRGGALRKRHRFAPRYGRGGRHFGPPSAVHVARRPESTWQTVPERCDPAQRECASNQGAMDVFGGSYNTTKHFSAVCYYFGAALQRAMPDVPVGLIHASHGGTSLEMWLDEQTLEPSEPLPAGHNSTATCPGPFGGGCRHCTATQNYNGMIRPLQNVTISGVVFYQGESNTQRVKGVPLSRAYSCRFQRMMAQVRASAERSENGSHQSTLPHSILQAISSAELRPIPTISKGERRIRQNNAPQLTLTCVLFPPCSGAGSGTSGRAARRSRTSRLGSCRSVR